MNRNLSVATSFMGSIARLGTGMRVVSPGARPQKRLTLYEFEGCPFCRKVREALSLLDLEALVLPCPKGGSRFRPEAKERGGKEQFPLLVDPNTESVLYESDAIVQHLFKHYGAGKAPLALRLGALTTVSSALASACRFGRGSTARPSLAPVEPLELWSFEPSPYCALVRERLSELEIPYVLHNVARGSSARPAFEKRSGRMMVPYLADPNTGRELFESADIVTYLDATYGAVVTQTNEQEEASDSTT